MIVNRPMVDWVTITGSRGEHVKHVGQFARMRGEAGEFGRIPRYRGERYESAFVGRNRALVGNGEYLGTVSGEAAHHFALWAEQRGERCSRLDVQITIDSPHKWNPRNEVQNLSSKRWATGKEVNPRLVEGTDGTASIYAGTRKSDREYCIYTKKDTQGREYLRYEVRFRNVAGRKIAATRWGQILQTSFREGAISAILWDALALLDTGWKGIKPAINALHDYGRGALPAFEVTQPERDPLAWVYNQVDPAVRRLIASHESREQMRVIVADWARLCAALDSQPRED